MGAFGSWGWWWVQNLRGGGKKITVIKKKKEDMKETLQETCLGISFLVVPNNNLK